MKRTTIPWLRLEPVLHRAVEEVLRDGESLSGFVESAWRAQIPQRQQQIDDGKTVTMLAVRHQREDDYH